MDFDISKVKNMIHELVLKTLPGLFKVARWNRFYQFIFLSEVIFLEGQEWEKVADSQCCITLNY